MCTWTLAQRCALTHPHHMPHPPRPTAAGLYHVAVRATTPDPLFQDSHDRITFVTQLGRTTALTTWCCLAACLMTTHYHLLVDVEEGVLPVAMKRLNWHTARSFNKRHGRRGHWVGGKYLSVPIMDESQLLTSFRYIVRNPVEAGLCERPEEWPWSSYGSTLGLVAGFEFVDASAVLTSFGSPTDAALERLRGFVETPWR